ncbi:MAG TPA: MBOAT family protein [Polyangia bacterium]|nr:MBOAT family protein [Polyangia bacterium]
MLIPYPLSIFTLAAPLLAGWAYVRLGGLSSPMVRVPIRVAVLALLCVVPVLTRGPGPVQMTLGLLTGYLAIRIVAVSGRWRADGGTGRRPTARQIARALVSVEDVMRPMPPRDPATSAGRAKTALVLGAISAAACVALLVLGARIRLWEWSRYADALLVCLEVGIGVMGINNLIIGFAAVHGRSVSGIQDRPMLSASLGELWARRWNHLVENNLARAFFVPLGRRGAPALGMLAAFIASGVMHVMPVLASAPPALTLRPAAQVLGFFLLSGGLVLAERAAGLDPPARDLQPGAVTLARVRTIVLFVVLTPLMLGPFADVTGVHGRSLRPPAPAPAPAPWAGRDQNFKVRPAEP